MNRRFQELGRSPATALAAASGRVPQAPRLIEKVKTVLWAVIDWFAEV